MKRWLRQLHLWLALLFGLFIVCMSVSGAILVYAKDLQTFLQPDKWQVQSQSAPLSFSDVISRVERQTQQRVELLMPESDSTLAWQLKLANNQYVSVDPYTSEILHQYDYYSTLYGFTMSLHRWLLYQDSDNQKPLRNWVSICALAFIVEILIGFYLWVKPKKRIKRLAINPRAKFRILVYQLHTVVGVYMMVPLIMITFAGIAFNWQDATQKVVETITFSEIETRPVPAPLTATAQPEPPEVDIAFAHAMNVFPAATLFRIYLPQKAGDHLGFRMQNPGESHAYSWVWADPYSGRVTGYYDASKANFTTQVWHFKYKFHIGDFAGPVIQLLWFVIALLPCFFAASGIYFWLKRTKSKR
ncbi:PepSY-associated TM helix domain-containing protein [Alteromonas gilva]|uniref:PepSY-associated TM helix domain-containing protein n=1 Tax=Alteromonas gilva TaxID=2987522 RepID=A0ABT5L123_9ALTE|nr:PepSY-associated TM helix domain-containing protein [Alteromonas gilva]MDC8830746.1 PepSY-associated TM helix domain-containing protein [Alteromonas gilva]